MQRIPSNTSIWLNVMRALAAQAVVIGHANYLFFDHAEGTGGALAWLVGLCSSGAHKAVIMFFVMSGFLIGGPVIEAMRSQRFDSFKYFIDRLTRLWIVILPALLMTALLDGLAFSYGGGEALLASRTPFFPEWWSSLEPDSIKTFVLNAFFMQMIIGFQYGTNLSLWSISNEFWYYLLLPAAFGIFVFKRNTKVLCVLLTLFIGFLFIYSTKPNDEGRPLTYFMMFVIWMMGAAAYCFYENIRRRYLAAFFLVVAFFMFIVFKRIYPDALGYDFALGFFTVFLIMISKDIPANYLKRISDFFSGYSFSLYALHLPLTFFLMSFDPQLALPQPIRYDTVLRFTLYLLAINGASILLWALTERHTAAVRRFVFAKLITPRVA
ncbi:acyltransferase [Janthinobacterium sp. LS2A]|uniref:acyltransferase family protein n=1 Tax=Janthinobacterium sp. LS2A TaxID=3118590 RepID=UPI002F940011